MKSEEYHELQGSRRPKKRRKKKNYPVREFYCIYIGDNLRYYSSKRYDAEKYQRRFGGELKVVKSLEELFNH